MKQNFKSWLCEAGSENGAVDEYSIDDLQEYDQGELKEMFPKLYEAFLNGDNIAFVKSFVGKEIDHHYYDEVKQLCGEYTKQWLLDQAGRFE